MADEPLTEVWLKANGFRSAQLERCPNLHWTLWVGQATPLDATGFGLSCDDLAIELSLSSSPGEFFCWFRADYAGRYSRFLHVRFVRTVGQLVRLTA